MKQAVMLILAAMVALAWQAQRADYVLTGTVTDATSGETLIGASVTLKGAKKGANTDFDGKFSLKSSDSCAVLVFSYTGYERQEATVCHGRPAQIALASGAQLMEEVIVTREAPQKRQRAEAYGLNIPSAPPMGLMKSTAPYDARMAPGAPVYDDGLYHNTEDYDVIQENRFLSATEQPLSTFSIDVDAASYSNVRRFIQVGQMPPKDAVRIEEMINYFGYSYPEPKGEHPFSVTTELGDCPWAPEHKLLHIGLKGKTIPNDKLPASNLVFLIDVSGSMNSPNKLPLLKSSFKLLADQLRPQDKVAIVVYAGAAGLVLPPTSGDNKAKIKDALEKLEAGGSTAGGAGIQLAYKTARDHFVKGGNNRVLLATDGDFNIGASSDAEMVRLIEKERESGVFLTVLGLGMGNYKDNKMQQLSSAGNGNHAYIDNISEAKKVLVNEFGGTLFTIAKDVKLQLEFNPALVQGYRLIGYENRMLNKEDFNDDKKDAGDMGSGHTVTALYEIIPAGVSTTLLAEVDKLKYQPVTEGSSKSKDWCTVKLRYKQPDGDKSTRLEHAVTGTPVKLDKSSENFRWSAAVAEFGMLLRESKFRGTASFLHAQKLAKGAKGEDEHGYRSELIRMMGTVADLAKPELKGEE